MSTPSDRPYHHGDLAAVLVREAVVLARSGGPDAVALREVARRAGVSATAAYRHFADRDALLGAVAREARQELGRAMVARRDQVRSRDPVRRAVDRLYAIGRAYVHFAVDEPGLIATAFLPVSPPSGGAESPDAFLVLAGCLSDLAGLGYIDADRIGDAVLLCWSAVHGLAMLANIGGLTGGPAAAMVEAATIDRAIDSVLGSIDSAIRVTPHGDEHPSPAAVP